MSLKRSKGLTPGFGSAPLNVEANQMQLRKSSDQSISATTWTDISFQTENKDTGGWFDSATDDDRFYVSETGVYSVFWHPTFTAGENVTLALYDHDNSAEVMHGAFDNTVAPVLSGVANLEAGVEYSVRVYTSSSSTVTSGNFGYRTTLEIVGVLGSFFDSEWYSASTANVFDLANSMKDSADTPDDEFTLPTLASKWTVVNGSSGTVSLLEKGEVEKYDLATRPGWLLLQAGSATDQMVELRQDFTIPDGASIVCAMAGPGPTTDAAGSVNNEYRAGIGVNSTDTGYDDGTYVFLAIDAQTDACEVLVYDGTTLFGSSLRSHVIGMAFLRIGRSGLVYYVYWSHDGLTWQPFATKTFGTAPDNLWLFAGTPTGTANEPVGITAVKWIRQGTNALDPWNPNARVAVGHWPHSLCRVERITTNFSIPSAATFTDIDWNDSTLDTSNYWEGVTNPERLTVPYDGIYRVSAAVRMNLSTNDEAILSLSVNGTATGTDFGRAPIDDLGAWLSFSGSDLLELDAGDYVTVQGYISGTPRDVVVGSTASIELVARL